MDAIVQALQRLDLHPVADHFTIAILILGVVIDLVASVASTRVWLRYMALTLMVLGAIAAGASYASGDIEADRVWKAIGPETRAVLHRHAEFAEYLAVIFGVLALWRILIEAIGFFAGSRPVYLIVALLAAGALLYTGSLGGELVYGYGVGTALMGSQGAPPVSSPTPTPAPVPNEALPMVSVPTPTATALPTPQPSPAPATPAQPPTASETPVASPSATPTPAAHPPSPT